MFEKAHAMALPDSAFPVTHQVRIRDQTISIDPPLERARSTWTEYLQKWLGNFQRFLMPGVISDLPRVRVFLFERERGSVQGQNHNYSTLVRTITMIDT